MNGKANTQNDQRQFFDTLKAMGWPAHLGPGVLTFLMDDKDEEMSPQYPAATMAWSRYGACRGGYLAYVSIHHDEDEPTEAALNPDGSFAFARIQGKEVPDTIFMEMMQELVALADQDWKPEVDSV